MNGILLNCSFVGICAVAMGGISPILSRIVYAKSSCREANSWKNKRKIFVKKHESTKCDGERNAKQRHQQSTDIVDYNAVSTSINGMICHLMPVEKKCLIQIDNNDSLLQQSFLYHFFAFRATSFYSKLICLVER